MSNLTIIRVGPHTDPLKYQNVVNVMVTPTPRPKVALPYEPEGTRTAPRATNPTASVDMT